MYIKDYIKMEDLKDGYLYKIIARNAQYGIWRAKTKGFTISRIKFRDNFMFEEHHYDCESFPTAQPIEKIEKSPFNTDDFDLIYITKDGIKYFGYKDEKLVLEYLNKFENINERDNLKPPSENPEWLKKMIGRIRREREGKE